MQYTHNLLKPLFMAAARQPLVGPHSGQEMALLLSGSKPVGMLNPDVAKEEINTLQKKVDKGTLLRLDVSRKLNRSFILYGWPAADLDMIASAKTALTADLNKGRDHSDKAFQKFCQAVAPSKLAGYGYTQPPINAHEDRLFKTASQALRLLPSALSGTLNAQSLLTKAIERKNAQEFIDGHRQAYIALAVHDRLYLPDGIEEKINNHLSQGLIRCQKFDCKENSDMVIFGQIGQEKNMDDLAFIISHYDNPAAIENSGRELTHQSEGQILGYSDQDIELFQNRAHFSNLHRFVLGHTHEWRRNIRQGLMKEMGPQWNRNP